jgi:hypothetical protein
MDLPFKEYMEGVFIILTQVLTLVYFVLFFIGEKKKSATKADFKKKNPLDRGSI